MAFEFLNERYFGMKLWWLLAAAAGYIYLKYRDRNKTEEGENMPEDYEDEDEGEEISKCPHCSNPLTSKECSHDGWKCEGCDEDGLCNNCSVGLGEIDDEGFPLHTVCKRCIDAAYPRKEKVVEKIVVKRVEVPKETIKVLGFSEPIL